MAGYITHSVGILGQSIAARGGIETLEISFRERIDSVQNIQSRVERRRLSHV